MKKLLSIALVSLIGNFALSAGENAIIELNKESYQSVIQNSNYLILDVYADWCGPCKLLAPVLKTLNDDYGHLYQFAKLEASEKNQELIQSLNVKGLPTVIFYENGKEVGRTIGFVNREKIKEALNNHFPKKNKKG
jgi:thioredoxin